MAGMDLDKILGAGDEAKVPNLDWLDISPEDVDNIPRPMNVEMIPELKEAWTHRTERSTSLIPSFEAKAKKASDEVSPELIQGVVETAKKAMMTGTVGTELAEKLGSLYLPEVIQAAKDELVKVAAEQGLLGNVYVDISCFDTCVDARRALGTNKIRLAKYVVGQPKRRCCRGHKNGYCDELRKNVVAKIRYDDDLLNEYSSHLKVAGVLAPEEKLSSKEELRTSLLRKRRRQAAFRATGPGTGTERSEEDVNNAFAEALAKQAQADTKDASDIYFRELRPILAYIQNQMLKGRMGASLKETIKSKLTSHEIEAFAPEIKKIASLQGLLGNVYVDISYYKDADEAIGAIKHASTNPNYLVNTRSSGPNDGRMARVAQATGCSELPKDGSIDMKIAGSYIDDLQFTNRISVEKAKELRNSLESSKNVLSILRDAFLASLNRKKEPRQGGQPGTEFSGETPKFATKDQKYRVAVEKAIEAGISVHDVEDKLAGQLSTPEAISMSRSVLASMREVDANTLGRCTTEKYQLDSRVRIKMAKKCEGCIQCGDIGCLRLGVKFAGKQDLSKPFFDIDPKTAKVLFDENPDVARKDLAQEYDMGDPFGSGMNISLDKMREKKAGDDIELDFNQEGLDLNIAGL